MKPTEQGYVYILTNPSFKEDWVKIGKSSRPVDIRSKELDNTAVPLPFEIFATMKTSKYNEVEKLVHKTIDRLTDLRIRQNREFFNVAPQMALDIFRDIAMTIDDAEMYVTGAFVKVGFFREDMDLVYQDEIHGNLFQQVINVMDLLCTKYLKAIITYEGIQRTETLPIPRGIA